MWLPSPTFLLYSQEPVNGQTSQETALVQGGRDRVLLVDGDRSYDLHRNAADKSQPAWVASGSAEEWCRVSLTFTLDSRSFVTEYSIR